MRLRTRLGIEEANRRGFEDGLEDSETEPLELSDAEKVAYDAARRRGVYAAERLERRMVRAALTAEKRR